MGHGNSKTAFVGIDHRPAAQSYMPCHLFGNSELYGLGIRLSFYIQYFAVIVALAVGLRPSKLGSIRIGLAIVAIALFVALCINATGTRSLVILDWYIGIALVAAYIFATDYVHAPYAAGFWIRARHAWSDRKARRRIRALVRRGGATGHEGTHATALLNAARHVYCDMLSRRSLHHSLVAFNDTAQAASDPVRAHTAQLAADSADEAYVLQLAAFNQDVVQGTTDFHVEHGVAIEAQQAVYKMAQREAAILLDEEYLRRQRRGTSLGYDHLLAGIICLSWAAYQCVKPWLYFVAVNRGARPQFGCDVKVFWFFVPISIYRQGFITFLKITSIISVIIAAFVALWGLYLLATSLFNLSAWSSEPAYSRVESQRYDGPDGNLSDASTSSSDHEGKKRKAKKSAATKREKRERRFYRWVALLQAIVLVIIIGVVEGTIAINHLDMSHSALGSTAELLAFLVALVTSVPILWECVIIVPLRLLSGRRAEPDFDMQEKPRREYDPYADPDIPSSQPAPAGPSTHPAPAVMSPAGQPAITRGD